MKISSSCMPGRHVHSLSKYILIVFMLLNAGAGMAQGVKLSPEMPTRGQIVTVTFTPVSASNSDTSQINDKDTAVAMVFTYSNLYNVPYRLPMQKKGSQWEASISLERYATYATFTLESGTKVQKPAKDKHYELPVYDKGKRIKSGYLYESYSLPAQMGKDPRVPAL